LPLLVISLLAVSIGAQQRAQNPAPAPAVSPQVMIVPARPGRNHCEAAGGSQWQRTFMHWIPIKSTWSIVMDQAASVHEKEAGFSTCSTARYSVTGGKLVDEKATNDANLSGTSISGGERDRSKK